MCTKIIYFSTKTYVVGTQENRLNETVLLSTKPYVKTDEQENIYNFTLKDFVYLNLCFRFICSLFGLVIAAATAYDIIVVQWLEKRKTTKQIAQVKCILLLLQKSI